MLRSDLGQGDVTDEVLAVALNQLPGLVVRRSRYQTVSPADVNESMAAWDRVWRSVGKLMPAGWAHLDQSVRAAVGNSLGGDATLAADRDATDAWPPDQFHPYWWDVSLSYCEYLRAELQRLTITPHKATKITRFDAWRAGEDAHALSRAGEETLPR